MNREGLDTDELRELHPAAVILECVGVRHAPRYDPAALRGLRAANRRLRGAHDETAALAADREFHRRLAAGGRKPGLLEAWEPVRGGLEPFKRVWLGDRGRRARSAAQHDAIVRALERGDRRAAERRLRAHHVAVLGELLAELEHGRA